MDKKIINSLESIKNTLDEISGQSLPDYVKVLLNGIEILTSEVERLSEENQKLKDEINHLKGEQGKPSIRSQKKDGNISSEGERKNKKKTGKRPARSKPKIDRIEKCKVDRSTLPNDAVNKGVEKVVVQDIVIKTDNVEFHREVFYSPSEGKRYIADLPTGYEGDFGPGIKALVVSLINETNTSQPAVLRLLRASGIDISAATISRIITDDKIWVQEKEEIVKAGLQSTSHQHIDDTGGRVNGKNHYVHILCNPYYTAYFTRPKKDRLTVIEILSPGGILYHLNNASIELMRKNGVAEKYIPLLESQATCQPLTQHEMDSIIKTLFLNQTKKTKNIKTVQEACAIIGYRSRPDAIEVLICDDAPQFKNITKFLELCWVHEGRHYKKLRPWLIVHRKLLETFLTDFWNYYHKLLAYKEEPTEEQAKLLYKEFDDLMSRKTGYDLLDDRIEKTQQKKNNLLLILDRPYLELHNNSAELGARFQARKRDVSLQTKNRKGTEAKDAQMTVVQTAKKLGVNVIDYIKDRLSKSFKMKSLADMILEKSELAPNTS